jgi:hypothetical protein
VKIPHENLSEEVLGVALECATGHGSMIDDFRKDRPGTCILAISKNNIKGERFRILPRFRHVAIILATLQKLHRTDMYVCVRARVVLDIVAPARDKRVIRARDAREYHIYIYYYVILLLLLLFLQGKPPCKKPCN